MKRFFEVLRDTNIPKTHHNDFSDFMYRTISDILTAVKKPLADKGLFIKLATEPVLIGERYYIKAKASVIEAETGKEITSADGYAREPLSKTKFDEAQVTGASSTYAIKNALTNLFACTDDNLDPDTMAPEPPAKTVRDTPKIEPKKPIAKSNKTSGATCSMCGKEIPEKVYSYSMEKFGKSLCYACQHKK
jgi:hypothetical protein